VEWSGDEDGDREDLLFFFEISAEMADAHRVLGEDVEMFKDMDGGVLDGFRETADFFLGVITKVEEGDTVFVVSNVELDLEQVLTFTGTTIK